MKSKVKLEDDKSELKPIKIDEVDIIERST